jgi:hypothetical protein
MKKKNLHRILYYVTLFTIITPAMIIVAIAHRDVRTFDRFYLKCNDILNNLKGEYEDIGR